MQKAALRADSAGAVVHILPAQTLASPRPVGVPPRPSVSLRKRLRPLFAWFPANALGFAGLVIGAVLVSVLFGLGGLRYYETPTSTRGYEPAHHLLRPAGGVGITLGMAGAGIMLMTLPYAIRKRIPSLARRGNNKRWLEAHIFCGLVGPALITIHAAFKFNGIISVAYWSMVLVVLSGFVGRYLYVRIPRSLFGAELSLDEIRQRSAELKKRVDAAGLPPGLAQEIDAEASGHGVRAALAFRRRLRTLKKELRLRGVAAGLLDEMADVVRERAILVRRMATLERTKKLFEAWHVFHRPLVWVMFAIAAIHVSLAIYMGYSRLHF